MRLNVIMQRFIALITCFCLALSGTSVVWAQSGLLDGSQAGSQAQVEIQVISNASQTINSDAGGIGRNISNWNSNDDNEILLFLAQADNNALGFDITAPTISHTPSVSKGVAGEVQTIVAEISDNQSVKSAQLNYRTSSAEFYSTTEMSSDVTNNTWLATIDTAPEDSEVHYYIVAEDTDGNRVQKGSDSSPLTLTLQQPEMFSAIAPVKKDNRTTWLAVGLGVFLVGALLASGGGSGGDGGIVNSDGENTCCTITFIVPNVNTE